MTSRKIKEAIDDAGFTFRRGDAADLADRLRFLIANPAVREAAGQAAKRRVREHYQWPQIAAEIERVYFEMMGWELDGSAAGRPSGRVLRLQRRRPSEEQDKASGVQTFEKRLARTEPNAPTRGRGESRPFCLQWTFVPADNWRAARVPLSPRASFHDMENTILVTGGAGFIGSNFILQRMERDSASIVNLDKLTYAGNLRNLESDAQTRQRYEFVHGDIADREPGARAAGTVASRAPLCILPPRATWIARSGDRMISSARMWMGRSRCWKKCGHIGAGLSEREKIGVPVSARFDR